MKHDAKGIDIGLYETTYRCKRCGLVWTESADDPTTWEPAEACEDVLNEELDNLEFSSTLTL